MAKIFWIAEKEGNSIEMFAFNNKRKAEQKAMELAPHFSFGDNKVPKDEDDDLDMWLYSGTINAKKCFILYREDGMPYAKGDFANASEAYGWMEEKGRKVVAGACFPVKLKGGMCSIDIWDQVGVLTGTELFKFDKYVENDPDFDWYADEVGPDGKPLQIWATPDGKKPKSESFKYVPTFESFLNEAKIEFGNLDPRNTEDKWKLEELNDMLRKAVGKKCTFLDIVNIAGHQSGFYDESTTKNTPKNVLKKINVEILDIEVGGSYDSMAHQIYYKYDAAPYNGYEYKTNGKADLTGEVAKYGKNNAKDENGDFNGAGVKFKDFPKIYPDCAAVTTARGFGSQKGFSSGSFLMYPKSDAAAMWSMFADVFRLGDITPTFESFIGGSQKVNENFTLLDSFDEYGWSDEYDGKYFPITNALNGLMDDLVWITDNFPDFIQDEGKLVKKYAMDGLDSPEDYDGNEVEDPHGDVRFSLYKYKGLKIGWFTDEYGYSAGLCHERDVKKWTKIIKDMGEEEYLDVF